MYCLFCVILCIVCVYYCHRVATQLQLNISYHIKYHISCISYISYIISYIYHIIYHIIYHTTYHIMYLISYIVYHVSYIISCTLTLWFVVVSRYLMRIWSRQPDCWYRHCMLGRDTWLSLTRHSRASHRVSCVLWIQAALICWKIFNMKIARLLKVSLRNWINILSRSMVHLPSFISPCK